MTTAVYQWRPRAKFNIDAQVAGTELERIKGHNSGDLTPEMVLAAAADKKSPLHSLFEWDNAKAAEQQRLYVAGTLIKSIVVTVTGATTSQPSNVNVTVTGSQAPTGTAKVVTEADVQQKKIERGWAELDRWINTYGALPEFSQIAGVIHVLTAQRQSKAA